MLEGVEFARRALVVLEGRGECRSAEGGMYT
jgi:hypothetical protein